MISVIMSVFNNEKTIEKSLLSLLEGSYKDIEIIIVNDGSTDSSEQIIREIQKRYSNVVLINNDENKGIPYSLNLAIKNAKGEYFVKELAMDSSGVREFFAWAIQIYRVVYENKVVFADEMDRVLNPVLSDRVISFINGKKHNGQFVFTSHNVLHLDLKTYMKEQIYFISKDSENLNSELYSLADFPEVRYETTKIYEFYMKGILGGTAVE